jgi:SMODS-associated and fused to various effectors sensor domain
VSSERGPAASGARLLGDDYQHLLTWLHAAQLIHRDPDVTRIELEKHAAGNVDDLVVHRRGKPALYHQVKFTTEPGHPLTSDWFIEGAPGDKSPLERFFESYEKLTVAGTRPEMVLHTNRLPAANDPILRCLDGTSERLAPKLNRASPRSAAGKARALWAQRIGVTEEQLLEMLTSLQIRAAQASLNSLQEHCRWVMDAVGLLATLDAIDKGMLAARRWVETGVRDVVADTVTELVDEHQLRAGEPIATVLIQAIEHDLWPETATVALDWLDGFIGEQPQERRETHDPDSWAKRFAPELRNAADSVRAAGYSRVRIDGAFRLATAIFAGSAFSDVAGFQLAVPGRSGDGTWTGDITSDGDRRPPTLTRADHSLDEGDELAIGLNISGDLTNAVLHHIQTAGLPIKQLVVLSLAEPGRNALNDPEDVRGWATTSTDQLRRLAEDGWPRFHLFLHGPRTAAALLGHQWNRMPPTQLWDDLGPSRGYTPAFTIPSA